MSPSRRPSLGLEHEVLLRTAADRLRRSRHACALTGAGLSVESGIPPFRAPGGGLGLWDRFDPMEYGTLEAFLRDPAKVWLMLRELGQTLRSARPNPGHEALARMESTGLVNGIITQNIDGLHQEAGSCNVVEFHGSWRTMSCVGCRASLPSAEVSLEALPPRCSCGAPLKPDVTLFGEIIPSQRIDAAYEEVLASDCLLIVGTSAEVAPASFLPGAARQRGAFLIEINTEETALTSAVVDLALQGPAAVILPRLLEEVGDPPVN